MPKPRTLQDQIPGLREAIEQETFLRDVAYLFEVPERIGPIEVRPLTLRHLMILSTTGNPLLVGGHGNRCSLGAFLWVVSPHYDPDNGLRRWWFLRGCRDILSPKKIRRTMEQVEEYLDQAFMDAPGSNCNRNSQRYWSSNTSTVHLLASEYGWSYQEIMELPVKILFQHVKLINHRKNPSAPMFNPSDSVRGKWIKEQNAVNTTN